jgi:SAM-dependent methyltransferase
MTGWQKLWKDPGVVAMWEQFPPLPQVIEMSDRLAAAGGRRVLDIGCGLGRHTLLLAARGFEVTGTDYSPGALAACRRSLAGAGLTADLLQLDFTEMPFPDGHFDGVVASHVIHHCDGPTLRRILRLVTDKLAPGGWLVWAMPSIRHWRFGTGVETDPGTFVDEQHWEGSVPHHYCREEEVRELLRDYTIESMVEHEFREQDDRVHWHWRVLARKLEEQPT